MAPPDKRAVAPGAQPVRVDNVQAESWVILDFPPPLIGRIYFATDDDKLDDDDMRCLEKIINPYQSKLKDDGRRGLNVNFEFYGYADKRHTKDYNYALAQRRADAVANYLGQPERLGGFPNYVTESKGRGIDYSIDGENSEELKYARRVDIHADHIGPEPKQTPETPETPVSTTWKARIYDAASIGYGVAAADTFFLEIADLKNNLAMSFHYRGLGVGWSWRGTPGVSAATSDWLEFKTMLKYNIMDFEGDVAHVCGQAQAGTGGGFDGVTLWGKSSKRITPRVRLWFEGFTKFDKGAGLGTTLSAGVLLPTPAKQKPYWPPRI